MKSIFLILFFAFIVTVRDNSRSLALSLQKGETRFTSALDSLPELNREIISFVNSKMNKKVGRGECWDLAAEALNATGAQWNGKLQFGRKLEKGEPLLPGDIIQFEGVKIKYRETNARYTQVMKHHTGIIHSLKGSKQFDMANQNTEEHGKKVSITYVDLEQITAGHYFIYRPVSGE